MTLYLAFSRNFDAHPLMSICPTIDWRLFTSTSGSFGWIYTGSGAIFLQHDLKRTNKEKVSSNINLTNNWKCYIVYL
jgi:hypothetical protein